ncbi:MAG: sensor histidine kinase [Betaproteobacteria bacterium]|nr:sensor histidine kinase [Betaproteobacteria bacterium]
MAIHDLCVEDDMNPPSPPKRIPTQRELEAAFLQFVEATRELEGSQTRLSREIQRLTNDLAKTNLELKSQIEAKGRLTEELAALLSALPLGVIILQRGVIYAFNDMASRIVPNVRTGQDWKIPRPWIRIDEAHFRCSALRPGIPAALEPSIDVVRPEYKTLPNDRLLVLLHDVTATFRAREQAERESKLSAMGQMAAEVAHQLRTPLATALIYAGHLVRRQLPEAKREQFSTRLNEQLKALDGLVSKMLGTLKNRPATTSLITVSQLIRDCQASIEPLCEIKGVGLNVTIDGGEHFLSVHENEIKGGVLSVLENALKFSLPGQSVRLTATAAQARLQILIEDDGPGISAQLIDRLFEPFLTSDSSSGTGLGLAIAKSAIQSHRGEIHGFNRSEGGASFLMVLPVFEAL